MKRSESGYDVYHIMDLIHAFGEDGVKKILSDFSSEYKSEVHNEEIERFLRKNALDFTRKKISVTYLVLDDREYAAGFFTLTHKPVTIRRDIQISKNAMRKLERHAKFDPALNAYHASAFLLAQFGKNFSLPLSERMSGQNLMKQALFKTERTLLRHLLRDIPTRRMSNIYRCCGCCKMIDEMPGRRQDGETEEND